jgi:hypothetical protein
MHLHRGFLGRSSSELLYGRPQSGLLLKRSACLGPVGIIPKLAEPADVVTEQECFALKASLRLLVQAGESSMSISRCTMVLFMLA